VIRRRGSLQLLPISLMGKLSTILTSGFNFSGVTSTINREGDSLKSADAAAGHEVEVRAPCGQISQPNPKALAMRNVQILPCRVLSLIAFEKW
jgi:hypothetical protein